MNLTSIFKLLGLGLEYSKIYTLLLEKGQQRMADIGKLTDMPRTSCYEYVPKLVELGLIEEMVDGKSKFYKAQNPSNLLSLLYKLKNDLNFSLKLLEDDFQTLMSKYLEVSEQKIIHEIQNLEEFEDLYKELKSTEDLYIIIPSEYTNLTSKRLASEIHSLIKLHKSIKFDQGEVFKLISNDKILSLSLKTGIGVLISDSSMVRTERLVFEQLYKNETTE